MKEKEFNLLDEPWIRVMTDDCSVKDVSLTDALLHAHEYVELAGELPTQDMAILRLLLAVLYTVFSQFDETGQPYPLEEPDDAYDRWENLWRLKKFPEQPICEYLNQYRERFYLFHPERPFWQVNEASAGTEFTAAKLNGAISESSNKVRLFPCRAGASKEVLQYGEAARWLIYLNGFDDTSAKPKQKGLPSPGAGWLGKLGLIAAQGDNLFETLMLNLVLLDRNGQLWDENKPVWELDKPKTDERTPISLPNNQAELLTLQSRRLLLMRDKRGVTGYKLLGGDFFDKANALTEQMTIWTHVEGKKNELPFDQPRRHTPGKQVWREFSTIVPQEKGAETPGVVRWQAMLEDACAIDKKRMVRFSVASVQYGDKDFFVTDVFSDSISFSMGLLSKAGRRWNDSIRREIELTDKLADEMKYFGMNVDKSEGGNGITLGNWMKEQFYYRIDMDFRRFLESIDPNDGYEKQIERLNGWREMETKIAYALANEVIAQSSDAALFGRTVSEKDKNGADVIRHYSVAEAYSLLSYRVRKIFE